MTDRETLQQYLSLGLGFIGRKPEASQVAKADLATAKGQQRLIEAYDQWNEEIQKAMARTAFDVDPDRVTDAPMVV